MNTLPQKQAKVDALVSKLLLRQSVSKSRNPPLVNSVITKIESIEGVKTSRRIHYTE